MDLGGTLEALAADPCAVGRAEVLEPDASGADLDERVMAGGLMIIDDDVGVTASDDDARSIEADDFSGSLTIEKGE